MTDTTSMTGATGNSDTPKHRYTAALAGEIERRWQDNWQEQGTFHAPNPSGPWAGDDAATVQAMEKFFLQDMFPYPSGTGLHVGHPLGFIATDFALVRAWKGDRHGNLVFRTTSRNFNPLCAMAGRVTVAEVEELVEPGELDPDAIHLPGIYIQRVVPLTPEQAADKRIEKRAVTTKTDATKEGA